MRNAFIGLMGASLMALGSMAAIAGPYGENPGDGASLPGAPGGRGGKSGLELAREQSRPGFGRGDEARLKRYCGDLLRRRAPRPDSNLRPRDCEDWFAELDRSFRSPRDAQPRDAQARSGRDGPDGPSVDGGQGGQGGQAGSGPGGAPGGAGGAGISGGRGGAGGSGGSGF